MLQRALDVFWLHGYAATSMSELQRALGIGRQSLYDTFGGKQQLFSEALELYLARHRTMVEQLLVPEGGLSSVRMYLMTTATNMSSTPRKACFLFNTSVELGPHDPQARTRLEAALDRMRQGFVGCLSHARSEGELAGGTSLSRLATFLVAQVGGMAALARVGAPAKDLQAVASSAMLALC